MVIVAINRSATTSMDPALRDVLLDIRDRFVLNVNAYATFLIFFFNIISDNSCILIWLIIYWMCFCFVLCLFLFFAFPLKSQIACKCTYFSYCILYTCIWLKEPRCIEVTHYYRTTTLFQNLQKKKTDTQCLNIYTIIIIFLIWNSYISFL